MNLNSLKHKLIFVLKFRYVSRTVNKSRNAYYRLQGMKIGAQTYLPKIQVTWPHQVSIGHNCKLERDIYFKFDGIWSPCPSIVIGDTTFIGRGCEFNISERIEIGNNALIASGCKFIDHNHGMNIGILMNQQKSFESAIVLEDDVWLGFNTIILKGVHIGNGAVVAAGSVVNKSIPSNEIWGGVPANKIGVRK